MDEEFIVSGYCRVIAGSRVLVCELTDDGFDSGCKYPSCDFSPNCALIKNALDQAEKLSNC